jgi:GntR family transcriptional regulator
MPHILDNDKPLPRYFQVYNSLLERIRVGEFANHALPAERQLAKDYGVSRITIVKAMDNLKHQGIIDRQHGRGTFVRSNKLINDPNSQLDFISQLDKSGLKADWQILDRGYFPSPPNVASFLKLNASDLHFQVTLLLKAEGQPVGYHHIGVRHELAVQNHADTLNEHTLIDFVRNLPQQQESTCQRGFEAVAASEEESRWLNIPIGAPVLVVDLLYTDPTGQIVQFIRSHFRGDRFRYNT